MGHKNKISEVKRFAYLPIFLYIKSYLLIIADYVLFLRELSDTLFLRQLANQQRTLVLRHDIAVETLHNHLLLTDGMHDAVMRVEELDVFAYCRIAV